jgi:hypothetical protein
MMRFLNTAAPFEVLKKHENAAGVTNLFKRTHFCGVSRHNGVSAEPTGHVYCY